MCACVFVCVCVRPTLVSCAVSTVDRMAVAAALGTSDSMSVGTLPALTDSSRKDTNSPTHEMTTDAPSPAARLRGSTRKAWAAMESAPWYDNTCRCDTHTHTHTSLLLH